MVVEAIGDADDEAVGDAAEDNLNRKGVHHRCSQQTQQMTLLNKTIWSIIYNPGLLKGF